MIKLNQKEIDELLGEETVKKDKPPAGSKQEEKKSSVIRRLSGASNKPDESTSTAVSSMEKIGSIISRQKSFLEDMIEQYNKNPDTINVPEVLNFLKNDLEAIQELAVHAKEALKSRDMEREKLLKIKEMVAKLQEYLS